MFIIYNVFVANSIKNKCFQKVLRRKLKTPFGLPARNWMLKIGAKFIGTEFELLLKSRKVYLEKLLNLGLSFQQMSFRNLKYNN